MSPAPTPAARSKAPRPDEAVQPSVPRPGRWAGPDGVPVATAEVLSSVRAELAELRARLDG